MQNSITHLNNDDTQQNIEDINEICEFDNYVEKFNETIDKIKTAFLSEKQYFLPGIKSMVNSYEKNVNTHSALLSAMMTFGNYSGLNPNTKNVKLVGNKHIGTQPTARARPVVRNLF